MVRMGARSSCCKRGLATTAALIVGVVAGAAAVVPQAQAQATCDWYAKTALEQQKVNVDRKCGFRGNAWSSDRASHMNWCREVPPDRWKQQAQQREQQLEKCVAGK